MYPPVFLIVSLEIDSSGVLMTRIWSSFWMPMGSLLAYRVVQLNLAPEMKVFYMLFDRSLSVLSMTPVKQHMEYFNLQC